MTPALLSPKTLFQKAHPKASGWWLNCSRGEDAQMLLAFAMTEWVSIYSPQPDQQNAVKCFVNVLLSLADPPSDGGTLPDKTVYPSGDTGAPATVQKTSRKKK